MILDLLIERLPIDNSVIAINEMLLQLMRQHPLQTINLKLTSHLLNGFGDSIIEVSGFELPECGLHPLIGRQHHISMPALDHRILIGLDDHSVPDQRNIPVDMDAQIDLHEVALPEHRGVLAQGGVVAADFVDGEAGGEGHALVDGLFRVDLRALGFDQPVRQDTRINNLHADFQLVEDLRQDD